jgi:hypothetical protein
MEECMQLKRKIRVVLGILIGMSLLSGCGSMRLASTLKHDPGMEGLKLDGNAKLSLSQVHAAQDKGSKVYMPNAGKFNSPTGLKSLKEHARQAYPDLFGGDFTDLPMFVSVDCHCTNDTSIETAAMLTAFTAGIIPFPAGDTLECKVRTRVADPDGYAVDAEKAFTMSSSMWLSLLSPLGLIPVPGAADIRAWFPFSDMGGEFEAKCNKLMMDSIVEAAAQGIAQADKTRLQAAAKSRRDRLREQTVHGARYWTYLGFRRSDPKSEGPFDTVVLMVFGEKPSLSARPLCQVTADALKNGKWQPVSAYLPGITPLTTVRVVMGPDGKPAGARLEEAPEPPLEDFVDLPDKCQPDHIRWSNAVLVEAKNTSLRKLVQQGSPEVLTRLVTRIEKAVLDLNERAQLADGRAQQLMVDGKDAKEETETAVLCRQRTAIFQAILPALKQAAARS